MLPSEAPNRNSTNNNNKKISLEFELQHHKAEDRGCIGVEGTGKSLGIWATLVSVVMRQIAGTGVK